MSTDDLVAKVMSEMGRRGGLARAKALTAKQRRESAIKASKAAAKVRTRSAKERKVAMTDGSDRPALIPWERCFPARQ